MHEQRAIAPSGGSFAGVMVALCRWAYNVCVDRLEGRVRGEVVMRWIMGLMVNGVLVAGVGAVGPPDAQAWERLGKIEEAKRLDARGVTTYQQGKLTEATKTFAKALELREGLYPRASHPQGHAELAESLNNLGFLYRAQGAYASAEPLYTRALEMREQLYPRSRYPLGHPYLALSLNNSANLCESQGDYSRAEQLYRRALEMRERLYPKTRFPLGHLDLAQSLNNLAALHEKYGESAKAEPLFRRALEIFEAQYPQALYPQGHPALATSLSNLAYLHQSQGESAKAEPLCRRALEMREGLYPRADYPPGHREVAESLNNLALLYHSQSDYAKAEPLFVRALTMYEALFPRARYPLGHPDLALSLSNLALLHQARGDYAKAKPLFVRALTMYEALFPRARYPLGHPDLALSLSNLALLHQARGDFAKAEPLLARAVVMYSDSATSLAISASEATALNYLSSNPLARGAYLSTTAQLPGSDAYAVIWRWKAAVSRIYERRHLAVLAASSREAHDLWEAVLSLKRRREALLLAPTDAARAKTRNKRLDEIEEDIRKKEADLLPLLPALKRSHDLTKSTPVDLCKALPANAVFIDLVRYLRLARDPKVLGTKGEKRTPHYVAFVVTNAGITRVELGEAEPIEKVFELWRLALLEAADSEPKYASLVHNLLWSPLLKHFPTKTTTVYVSPAAALNKLPWSALRDGKTNRVLIEEYAVAVVPHGPMLLDRLTEEKGKTPTEPTLLVMGGVVYDKNARNTTELALRGPVGDAVVWGPLAGTAKELTQVVELAGKRKVLRREGSAASAPTLLADLPQAETAHLATHGFFADAKFRTAMQFDEKLFGRGKVGERSGAGSRSPLILSGIVCSGANLPDTPNRGVVTADAIVGLDLRKLNLAVLSACETGLGDVAGGEGVYGLVRAFHVAGTRNVVASLWKVDDEATAALMVLFYRNLWGKEKVSPREALRRAQVSLYREPGRIAEWSQGRGPLPRPVAGGVTTPDKGPKAKTSPARAWAAFVLSGPGD